MANFDTQIAEGHAAMPEGHHSVNDVYLDWDRHPEGFRNQDRRERITYDTDGGYWWASYSDVCDDGFEYGHGCSDPVKTAGEAVAWLIQARAGWEALA